MTEVPQDDAQLSVDKRQPVILVVDDEEVVADTLSIILSRAGFATMTAYDGPTALELADAIPPELLISDVAMPEMNGVDLAVTLVNAQPSCKVLLFSGHATSADLLAARAAGYSFPLLTKPVHPADMLKRVLACLTTAEMLAVVQ